MAAVYAALERYDQAVEAMRSYLAIAPAADDARAAQDKIYEWEAAARAAPRSSPAATNSAARPRSK